jgi:hypothetical protein
VSSRPVRVLAAISLTLTPVLAAAGQSSVAVSPFVSYIPSAVTNPLAGFALTFGGTTGLALRSSAEMSIANPRIDSAAAQTGGYRPWAADADAMLFLGGLGGGATVFSRALAPYVFAGIGLSGSDSAGKNMTRNGWSYGAGATIPLGLYADIFAEARWRMQQYVLPTSHGAPDSKSSMRFGLSFHVGGSSPPRGYGPRRRMEAADARDDDGYIVTQAPAQPPVVVVTPAPATEPQVVVVEQEPAPEPVVIEREPATLPAPVITPRTRRRTTTTTTTTVVTARPRVLGGLGRGRGAARVAERRTSSRVTVQQPPASGGVARRSGTSSSGGFIGRATKSIPRAQAKTQVRTTTPQASTRTKRARAAASKRTQD